MPSRTPKWLDTLISFIATVTFRLGPRNVANYPTWQIGKKCTLFVCRIISTRKINVKLEKVYTFCTPKYVDKKHKLQIGKSVQFLNKLSDVEIQPYPIYFTKHIGPNRKTNPPYCCNENP